MNATHPTLSCIRSAALAVAVLAVRAEAQQGEWLGTAAMAAHDELLYVVQARTWTGVLG